MGGVGIWGVRDEHGVETTETTETTAIETTWGPSGGYGDDVGMMGTMWGQHGDNMGTTGTTWGGDHRDNGDHSHGDHMGTFWGLWG